MRKYLRVGSVLFAVVALGVAMTHASLSACASPEPIAPEAAGEKSAPPPPAASSAEAPEPAYFPATKSGGFIPQERRGKK
jgi:hypothetical protein